MEHAQDDSEDEKIVWTTEDLWEADPNCKHEIEYPIGGGIKCTKCPGWFCY